MARNRTKLLKMVSQSAEQTAAIGSITRAMTYVYDLAWNATHRGLVDSLDEEEMIPAAGDLYAPSQLLKEVTDNLARCAKATAIAITMLRDKNMLLDDDLAPVEAFFEEMSAMADILKRHEQERDDDGW